MNVWFFCYQITRRGIGTRCLLTWSRARLLWPGITLQNISRTPHHNIHSRAASPESLVIKITMGCTSECPSREYGTIDSDNSVLKSPSVRSTFCWEDLGCGPPVPLNLGSMLA